MKDIRKELAVEKATNYFLYKTREIHESYMSAKNDFIDEIAKNSRFFDESSIEDKKKLEEILNRSLYEEVSEELRNFVEEKIK